MIGVEVDGHQVGVVQGDLAVLTGVDHHVAADLMGRRLQCLQAGELVVIDFDQVFGGVVVGGGVGAEVAWSLRIV